MSAFLSDAPVDRRSSLGDILAVLGATGLRLVSSELGRDLAAARTVLFEPRGDLDRTPGGILLAAGLSVEDPEAVEVVARSAARGFSAVVVKSYGQGTDELARAADDHGVALLVVHDEVQWLSLDSHLNSALVTASQVGSSVSSVAVGDLFSLAEAIADTVGGATAVEDVSQRILAYSSREDHPIDPERRDGILGRQVPELPENAEQYRAVYRAPGPVRFPAAPEGYGRLAVAVRAGTELLGSIWVVDVEESLGEQAEEALLGAASVAALHMLRARSAEDLARQQRDEAARRLLESTGDPVAAAAALGLQAEGPFAVVAFGPARIHDTPAIVAERLMPLVALHCDTRLGRSGSALLDGVVYVVGAGSRVTVPGALEALAAEVVAAGTSALRLPLVAGIGPVVRAPARVGTARVEAGRVLGLLRHRLDLGPVATSDRVSDQMALAALGDALAKDRRLVPRRARAVLAHDAEHGTDYAGLLVAHLDDARDVARTAERLAVHPNTVRYRLRRAAEIFDLDLADPDQALPLWLALRTSTVRSTGAAHPD